MKKKTGILIGVVITVLLVITGTVGFVLMNYMVLYECQIEFHYEDYKHRNPEPPCDNLFGDEGRNYVKDLHRILLRQFNSEYYSYTIDEMVRRCQSNPKLKDESERRIRTILLTRRIDLIEESCANSFYAYRLVLTDLEKRNLDEFARLCMTMFKEKFKEECRVRMDKAISREVETIRKAERRIEELEKAKAEGKEISTREEELRMARHMIAAMKMKIEEIRKEAMSNEGRIIYESQPEVSWVIRRKR